jgi:hypothetical protein
MEDGWCVKTDINAAVGECVFSNPNPGGMQFLRPILLTSEKETAVMSLRINEDHEEEISNLNCYTFTLLGKTVTVHYIVEPAMRDGKEIRILACDILRKKANSGIYLKKWPSKKFILVDNVTCSLCLQRRDLYSTSFNFDPVMFHDLKKYGFFPLHKKIRVMEWIWKGAEKRERSLTGKTLKDIKENF